MSPRFLGITTMTPFIQAEGIEAFILSGYPHINECDMFARYVLPRLEHGSLEAS